MQELAANGVNGNLSEYLSAHKDATLVSDPGHLGLVKYFEDVIPPAFIQGYPTVGAGDTNARVSVMTDKPATIYYLITPRTAVDSPMFPDPSNPKRVPMSQEQLMSGGFKPAGSKWGSFRVENAGQVVTEIIRDLSASEEYYIFYLAKGTKPSEIGWQRVETEAASTPRFKEPYPQRAGQGPGVSYVTVRFEDASAEVYWVAYPVGQFPGTNSPTREQITGEEIGSGASPVDSGSKILTENEEWRITIKNLKEGQFYDFFVVAKNPLGETWTEIREIRKITASDSSTPYILSATTTIGDYTQGNLKNKYDGVVTVIFSEPLSYVSDSYGTWGKLTDYIVQTQLNCAFGQVTGVTTKTGDPSTNAINWLQIKFTGSPSGDAITFPYIVGDGVNRSGYLKMVLVETRTTKDGVTTYDAVWDVKFVDRL